MAAPKCPDCKIEGIDHLVSEDSTEESKGGDPWFNVVYCDNCGHVYGVFAKVTLEPKKPSLNFPFGEKN